MLAKIRNRVNRYIRKIGRFIAILIPFPNIITLLGLMFAIIFLITVYLDHCRYIYTIIFYSLSAIMDILDGAVARAIGKSSKLGSFLDSIVDRVSDTIYIAALYHILNLHPIVVLLLLFGCLMVSYIRAKAESMELEMEGIGIAERGDRIILIFIILLVNIINVAWAYYLTLVLLFLTIITVIQRIFHVMVGLRKNSIVT